MKCYLIDDNPKNTGPAKYKRLKKAHEDPMTEIYLSLYTSALRLFTYYNLLLLSLKVLRVQSFKFKYVHGTSTIKGFNIWIF